MTRIDPRDILLATEDFLKGRYDMKMTTEHYVVLREQVLGSLKDGLQTFNWTDSYDKYCVDNGITETGKLWDIYWNCGGNDWKGLINDGNTYGGVYTDKHITTAMKKIYKELRTI